MQAASETTHERRLNAILAVLGAVGMNVRPDGGEERHGHVLVEHMDVVDVTQRQQHPRAFVLANVGAPWALVRAHGSIAIEAHDQEISLQARFTEDVKVSGMEDVERSVDRHDPLSLRSK